MHINARNTASLSVTVGSLAYLDRMTGMIPCKVLDITPKAITIKVTATRGPYKRGEVIPVSLRHHVVPRKAVYVRGHQYRIASFTVA